MPPSSAPPCPTRSSASWWSAVLDGRYAPGERLPDPARAGGGARGEHGLAARGHQAARAAAAGRRQARRRDARARTGARTAAWTCSRTRPPTDPHLVTALFEARRLLLTEAARLAARAAHATSRRRCSTELAAALAAAETDQQAQRVDLAFFAAADRRRREPRLHADPQLDPRAVPGATSTTSAPIVRDRAELAPLYAEAAEAIARQDADRAAEATRRVAAAQEERMCG